METITVENSRLPYRIAVGRTIIECERAEEVVALADLLRRESVDEQAEPSTRN